MPASPRLIRDGTGRFKLKVSLTGGRYQLSLDNSPVVFLTDELGYTERDSIPSPFVPIFVAMGDAWFPRERDIDQVIEDLHADGSLPSDDIKALRDYVTSASIQERHVDRVLDAIAESPLEGVTESDLNVQSLPSLPSSLTDEGATSNPVDASNESTTASVTDQPSDPVHVESPTEDFERIPGIGPDRAEKLGETELTSLTELAESRPSDIATVVSISEGIAAVAIEGARELVGHDRPTAERLAAKTGVQADVFENVLSQLAAGGVPPSEAERTLQVLFGSLVTALDAVTNEQAYYLWESGYQTPADVADASVEELESVYQISSASASDIRKAAREMVEE